MGLNRAAAMICDPEVLESQLLCSFRHLLDGVVPIACGCVTMKCAPQVFLLNEFWQRMVLSGFEFTPILSYFRRFKIEFYFMTEAYFVFPLWNLHNMLYL